MVAGRARGAQQCIGGGEPGRERETRWCRAPASRGTPRARPGWGWRTGSTPSRPEAGPRRPGRTSTSGRSARSPRRSPDRAPGRRGSPRSRSPSRRSSVGGVLVRAARKPRTSWEVSTPRGRPSSSTSTRRVTLERRDQLGEAARPHRSAGVGATCAPPARRRAVRRPTRGRGGGPARRPIPRPRPPSPAAPAGRPASATRRTRGGCRWRTRRSRPGARGRGRAATVPLRDRTSPTRRSSDPASRKP